MDIEATAITTMEGQLEHKFYERIEGESLEIGGDAELIHRNQ